MDLRQAADLINNLRVNRREEDALLDLLEAALVNPPAGVATDHILPVRGVLLAGLNRLEKERLDVLADLTAMLGLLRRRRNP